MDTADKTSSGLITDRDEIIRIAQSIGLDLKASPEQALYEMNEICQDARSLILVSFDSGRRRSKAPSLPSGWTPYDSLRNITTLEDSTVRGETQLYRNSSWSADFVHSSDLMLPVGIFFEGFIAEENPILTINKLKILEPITREMTIYAAKTGNIENVLAKERNCPSFTIELSTQKGENIVMAGFQAGESIPVKRVTNDLLSEITRDFIDYTISGNTITFSLTPWSVLKEEEEFKLGFPLSGRLSTAVDTIISAARFIPNEMIRPLMGNISMGALVAGFDGFYLPQMVDLLQGGSLALTLPAQERTKACKTGFIIAPVSFKLIDFSGTVKSNGIINLAIAKQCFGTSY